MIRSMTGFARRERQGPWGTLTCELRTVNHRYLEVSLRLPEDLRGLEGDARQILSASLRRGKVDAGLYLRSTVAATPALEINQPMVEQLLLRAAEVSARLGDRVGAPSAFDVLRWPGVVREAEREITPLAAEALELLKETSEQLNESRAREGARIREMLQTRCQALVEAVALVRARLPEVSARIRAKVSERIAQLGTQVDPERQRVEVRGRRVRPEPPQYRLLLKPRGCLATLAPSAADTAERRSLARFIPDLEVGWLVVAPLDFLAEGVILLTTDGTLAARMSRSGGHVPMTYHLKLQGAITAEDTARLARGWKWEGRPVKPSSVEPIATTGKNTWVEMVVPESRARVLKAAGESIRHTVLKISRVKLGQLSFEGLRMGGFRDLTKPEIKSLLRSAGLAAS